jgi:hypothetical protein
MFDLNAFVKELITRFLSGKPEFFKTLQVISFVLMVGVFVVSKLPILGVNAPEWIATYANYALGILAAVIGVAQLPMTTADKEAAGIK